MSALAVQIQAPRGATTANSSVQKPKQAPNRKKKKRMGAWAKAKARAAAREKALEEAQQKAQLAAQVAQPDSSESGADAETQQPVHAGDEVSLQAGNIILYRHSIPTGEEDERGKPIFDYVNETAKVIRFVEPSQKQRENGTVFKPYWNASSMCTGAGGKPRKWVLKIYPDQLKPKVLKDGKVIDPKVRVCNSVTIYDRDGNPDKVLKPVSILWDADRGDRLLLSNNKAIYFADEGTKWDYTFNVHLNDGTDDEIESETDSDESE